MECANDEEVARLVRGSSQQQAVVQAYLRTKKLLVVVQLSESALKKIPANIRRVYVNCLRKAGKRDANNQTALTKSITAHHLLLTKELYEHLEAQREVSTHFYNTLNFRVALVALITSYPVREPLIADVASLPLQEVQLTFSFR